MITFEQVLEFWFGTALDEVDVIAEKSALWWSRDPELDAECKNRFEQELDAARAGELDEWAESPRGRLAVIILLDQISRSIHRGSARAFAGDARALQLATAGITRRHDRELRFCERLFFYMPFQHSESLDDQKRSVDLFRGLLTAVPSALEERFSEYLDYAIAHRDLVERFGRFPHRNAVLGRQSTEEELAYLSSAGAAF